MCREKNNIKVRKGYWDDREIEILKEYYPTKTAKWIKEKFLKNKSENQIRREGNRQNIIKAPPWTKEEISILLRYYEKKGPKWLHKNVLKNRSIGTIRTISNKYNLNYKKTIKKNFYVAAMKQAKFNEGICLDPFSERLLSTSKLRWKCKNGHVWKASINNIIKGRWCPKCNRKVGEEVTRRVFEHIFNEKFPSSNPDWLINPKTNCKLQLDGYCEKLRIAFEYDGYQHRTPNTHFNPGAKKFEDQIYKDKLKDELCKKFEVTLIRINSDKIKNIYDFEKISEVVHKKITERFPKLNCSLDGISFEHMYIDRLQKIHEVAKSKEGYCLNTEYKGSEYKYTLQCSKSHIWKAKYNNVVHNGTWCPRCATIKTTRSQRNSIEDAKKLAENKNGKCLSEVYVRSHDKLKWECSRGHQWKASYANVYMGKWCPYCWRKTTKGEE